MNQIVKIIFLSTCFFLGQCELTAGVPTFVSIVGTKTPNEYGDPTVCTGWKALPATSNSVTITFTALATKELVVWLKATNNQYLKITLGDVWRSGIANQTIHTARCGIYDFVGNKESSKFFVTSDNSQPGNVPEIPDTENPVLYTFNISSLATTGSGLLSVTARKKDGTIVTLLQASTQIFNKQFTHYTFKTISGNTIKVGGDSAVVLPPVLTTRGGYIPAGSTVSTLDVPTLGFKAISGGNNSAASNAFNLSFKSLAKKDLMIWLKGEGGLSLWVTLGAANNTNSTVSFCQGTVLGSVITVANGAGTISPSGASANAAVIKDPLLVSMAGTGIIPDTVAPVTYVLSMAPEVGTNKFILTLKGTTIDGVESIILCVKTPRQDVESMSNKTSFEQQYSGYLFTTSVGTNVCLGGDVLSVQPQASSIPGENLLTSTFYDIGPGTCFGWKPLPAANNNFSLAFKALKANDLFFAVKCGTKVCEFVLGGWANVHGSVHVFDGSTLIEGTWLSGTDLPGCTTTPGYRTIIPDIANPIDYVVTISPEPGTANGILTVIGKTQAGEIINLLTYKTQNFNQQFTHYSFKAWNGNLRVSNDVLFGLAQFDEALVFAGATTKITKLNKLDVFMASFLTASGSRDLRFKIAYDKCLALLRSIIGVAGYSALTIDEKNAVAKIIGRGLSMQSQYLPLSVPYKYSYTDLAYKAEVSVSDRIRSLWFTASFFLDSALGKKEEGFAVAFSVILDAFNGVCRTLASYNVLSDLDKENVRKFLALLSDSKTKSPDLDISKFLDISSYAPSTTATPYRIKINGKYFSVAGSLDQPLWAAAVTSSMNFDVKALSTAVSQDGSVDVTISAVNPSGLPTGSYPLVALSDEQSLSWGLKSDVSSLRIGRLDAAPTTFKLVPMNRDAGPGVEKNYSLLANGLSVFVQKDSANPRISVRGPGVIPQGYELAKIVLEAAPTVKVALSGFSSLPFDDAFKQELLAAHVDFLLDKMFDAATSSETTVFDSQRFVQSSKVLVAHYDDLLPRQKDKLMACLML